LFVISIKYDFKYLLSTYYSLKINWGLGSTLTPPPSSYILPEEVLAELLKLNIQKSSGLDGVRVHSTYANI
jgi:hypothetical protein